MRSQKDLEPLLGSPAVRPDLYLGRERYRYRIVCRHGDANPLSISFWYVAEAAQPRSPHRSGRMSLVQFMDRFDAGTKLLKTSM